MRRIKKRTVFCLILLLVIAALVALHIYASRPSVGVISEPGDTSSNQDADIFRSTPVPVSDKYVSFTVPKSLVKQPNNPMYSPEVDEYNYSYKDSQTWDLAISITNVSYGIAGNSGYMLRNNNPEEYSETTEIINRIPIYIFTDKTVGGFSKVAFMQNGTYQASISLVGDDFGTESNLQKTFDQVLNSWHWFVS